MGKFGGNVGVTLRRALLTLVCAGVLTACTAIYQNHGYIPPEQDLAQISVGVDTRDTVITLLGPPTSTGLSADSGLYYVQSKFRHYGPMQPEEIDRQVLAITFTPAGLVENIERFGLEQGQVVVLSRRVTSDNVRDTTLLRQLFGAIGNFDAGSVLGGP
jgi:outer membrane protein assembly factor BamE (lipoprotein component of BamABCDE complex)